MADPSSAIWNTIASTPGSASSAGSTRASMPGSVSICAVRSTGLAAAAKSGRAARRTAVVSGVNSAGTSPRSTHRSTESTPSPPEFERIATRGPASR